MSGLPNFCQLWVWTRASPRTCMWHSYSYETTVQKEILYVGKARTESTVLSLRVGSTMDDIFLGFHWKMIRAQGYESTTQRIVTIGKQPEYSSFVSDVLTIEFSSYCIMVHPSNHVTRTVTVLKKTKILGAIKKVVSSAMWSSMI